MTDGNVTRSDVNGPFNYCCCIYWPDVIVPIYFVLYLLVHDVKEPCVTRL